MTLTTDFGEGSSYVAAMKGALYTVNPAAKVVDLTHAIPPHDVVAATLFLSDVVPYYPPGTIHVVVVDPGVGTPRALLCVETEFGVLLAPDNGCWSEAVAPADIRRVIRLTDTTFWRPSVSATFHGRDILAPVAGHLSMGLDPAELGAAAPEWVTVHLPKPTRNGPVTHGEIVSVDRFGNMIANVRLRTPDDSVTASVAGRPVKQFVKTYGDAEPGRLVALIGSSGRLEFAVVNGSAAALLGVGVGAAVEVVAHG